MTATGSSENPNPPSFFEIESANPSQLNDETLGDIKVDGNTIVQLFAQYIYTQSYTHDFSNRR